MVMMAGFVSLVLPGCATTPVPERLLFLGYNGKVNEHSVLVQAPPSRVFSVLTDFDQFAQLVPGTNIRVTKITPGPISVGTVIRTETGYRIKLRWHSQVVEKQRDQMLVLRFLDGIFRDGYEIWGIQPTDSGTQVSHTLLYNISSPPYRLLWILKDVENKHNVLVEATLQNLKQRCETECIVAPPQS